MIGESPFAWTVIVQNVTEPRLALLHQQNSRRILFLAGEDCAKGAEILTELLFQLAIAQTLSARLRPPVSGPAPWQDPHTTLQTPRLRAAPPTEPSTAASALRATDAAGVTRSIDVGLEPVAGRAPLSEAERAELALLGDELPHQRADNFVSAPERHALAHQVIGNVRRQQQSGCRRGRRARG